MLFFSQTYLFIFLPLILTFFYFSKFIKIDITYLLILFSLIFYSWWNIYYLPLIIFSIIINYNLSKGLIETNKNKKLLFVSIVFNIFILIIFKYLDFIILNINSLFNTNIPEINLPFPLALSFVTFQVIAFLVNCYDKEIDYLKFKDFFLFIIFFPQLIAGPIVRYNYMHPQFKEKLNKVFNYSNFSLGFIILIIGLIKKTIFADGLSIYVDYGFENYKDLDFISSWILSFSFTFQLYFDFSGYIDMATGSALMLNILLPKNFNSPFKSLSIIDFWQRWHITLSNFLTNYIYIPWAKSINNINFLKSMFIITIVFLIAGIWHGPSWTFVLFGLIHGLGIVINHIFKRYNLSLNNFFSWFLTFNYINFSFIFFRAENINQAFEILKSMFSLNMIIELEKTLIFFKPSNLNFIIIFVLSFLICFLFKNSSYLIERYFDSQKIN